MSAGFDLFLQFLQAVTTVRVLNVSPSVDPGPAQAVDEGDTVSLAATFTDAGVLDTHTATIDWGDGTVEAGVVLETDGSGSATGSHVYAPEEFGQYGGTRFFTVTVTVTDDDSGTSGDSLIIEVVSPPIVVAANPLGVVEGSLIAMGTLMALLTVVRWGWWNPSSWTRRRPR